MDKREKVETRFQLNNLVRTADLKKTFSEGDTTNWFYKLHKITEIFNGTIANYRLDNLPERENEALLKKTKLTKKEKKDVMKNINLCYIKLSLTA